MSMTFRVVAAVVIALLTLESVSFAIDSKNEAYFGGTLTEFVGAKDPVEGKLDTTNPNELIFTATDKPFVGKKFSIPYSKVIDLEYGQKAGRRVGAAAATTVLLGPIGLLSLFSKKRKHYLTVDESISHKWRLARCQAWRCCIARSIDDRTQPLYASHWKSELRSGSN